MGGQILELESERLIRIGKEQGMELGRAQGMELGREQGMGQISDLNAWLVKQGRTDELFLSFNDRELQQKLLQEMKEAEARVGLSGM
ncbi:MAG: hypothetical protein K5987_00700 [Lachnospiraceae bacterium]|nr:hypothetical protein [Lachnospiraceae bacterium]